MSEATPGPDILEGVFAVDEGDDVRLAVHDYEWTNPYEVTDVDHVDWEGATGEVWATREVIVEGGYDSTFEVTAVEGDDDLELRRHPGGQKRGDLERFKPVDEDSNESGTSTEDDTSTSDVNSESEAEAEAHHVDLEEDAADDAGDDGQERQDAGPITVDAVDEPDDLGVGLPDGVTASDVEAAVDEHETLGDVGEAIGVTRGRARTITVSLGCYSDVDDLPAGGRGQLTVSGWLAYAIACLLTLGAALAISTGVIVP